MVCPVARLLLALCFVGLPALAWAIPSAEQRQEAAAAGTLMSKAANLYKAGKFKDAGAAVTEAQQKLEALAAAGDKILNELIKPSYERLAKAHELLELEGVKLSALKPWEEISKIKAPPPPMPATPANPATPATGAPALTAVPAMVSFPQHIAPLLIGKCGRCHVNESRGQVSLATFEALMKGPPEGKIIFPGDAIGSRIIEVIESGDMPRGGLKLSAVELDTLKKWIADGAKFEGDPKATLASLAPNVRPAEMPKVTVTAATGKETVSFARDVAPMLASSCVNCHGTQRPRENFSVNTFETLLRGGDGGPPVIPGKPADSLLLKKLKGTAMAGKRMPLNQPAIADAVIAKVETWIAEGAKFDGPDNKMPVTQVAAIARAQGATHAELSADRSKLAETNWRLTTSSNEADRIETDHFLILGNVGPNTLAEAGKQADAIAQQVATLFKAPEGQPLVRGRMSLFVFRDRYDLTEFGSMVEQRKLPPETRGVWRHNIVDAYAAYIQPKPNEGGSQGALAHYIAAGYVGSLGKGTPRWFAEGAGRVAASRLAANDERVQQWDDQLPAALSGMSKPDAFLSASGEDAEIASFSFVRFLMTDSKRFQALLDQLRQGGDFEKSFQAVYGGSPAQLTAAWAPKAASARPTKKAAPKK